MNNQELYHYGLKGMKWGVRRYQNSDGTLTDAGKKRYSSNAHEDYKKAHSKKSIKQMSDAELRNRNNRLQMEQQYRDLKRKSSAGKRAVDGFIKTAGTIAAVTAAYKTYKKVGDKAIDAIGNLIMTDLVRGFSR